MKVSELIEELREFPMNSEISWKQMDSGKIIVIVEDLPVCQLGLFPRKKASLAWRPEEIEAAHKIWDDCNLAGVPLEKRPMILQQEPTVANLSALEEKILAVG